MNIIYILLFNTILSIHTYSTYILCVTMMNTIKNKSTDLLKRTIVTIPLLLLLVFLYNNIILIKDIIAVCSIIMYCEFFYNIIKAVKKQVILIYHGFCNSELNKVTIPELRYILLFFGLMLGVFTAIVRTKNISEVTALEVVKMIILITISDILQYIFGKIYGNTIFSNKTLWFSPNKTYEGYIFGCFVAILGGIVLEFDCMTSIIFVIGGVIGGIISSAAKRSLEIKDWSSLLFSHGGFIDRCDGYIIPLTIILLNSH